MNEKQTKDYIASRGRICPFCNGMDISSENNLEVNEGRVFQNVFCGTCENSWTDIYTLTGADLNTN